MNAHHHIAHQAVLPVLPTTRLLRLPLVLRVTGLGRSTIYRMIAKKQFPRPCRIGDRAVAWRQIDIEAWIDQRSTAL